MNEAEYLVDGVEFPEENESALADVLNHKAKLGYELVDKFLTVQIIANITITKVTLIFRKIKK